MNDGWEGDMAGFLPLRIKRGIRGLTEMLMNGCLWGDESGFFVSNGKEYKKG